MGAPRLYATEDLWVIRGRELRVISQDNEGLVLGHHNDPTTSERISYEDAEALLASPDLVLIRGYFDHSSREIEIRHGKGFSLCSTALKRISAAIWRRCCVAAFLQKYEEGSVQKTEFSITAAKEVLRTLAERLHGRDFDEASKRAGQDLTPQKKFPCAKSLLTWVRKFLGAKQKVEALCDALHRSGNRSARWEVDELALMNKVVEHYCSTQKPTKVRAIYLTRQGFRAENEARQANGLSPLRIPSIRTIGRYLNKVGAYYLYVRRNGVEAANKKWTFVETGLEADFPLQRVEIDENKLDVISLFTTTDILRHLTPEQRKSLERGRRYLYLAVDCATKCIVGLRLSKTPNTADALLTVKDICRDKSAIAKAFGCHHPWDMYGRPFQIVADHGSAFHSGEFQTRLALAGIGIEHPPAGKPHLRGTVERMFLTLGHLLFSELFGRTFHSPQERGDYPSEKLACLTDDELVSTILSVLIDIYHHQPQEVLGGLTPAQKWQEFEDSQENMIPASPTGEEMRRAFGGAFERKSNAHGLTWQSIHYSCDALREIQKHHKSTPVSIHVDYDDIGWVLVEHNGKYFPATSNLGCFNGMSFREWEHTRRLIRQRYGENAEINEPIAAAALDRVRETADGAFEREGRTPFKVTEGQSYAAEQGLKVTLTPDPEWDGRAPIDHVLSAPEDPADPLSCAIMIEDFETGGSAEQEASHASPKSPDLSTPIILKPARFE